MKKYLNIALLMVMLTCQGVFSQRVDNNNFLLNLMQTRPQYFADIINNSAKYRLQIIYTQIDRDSLGKAHFTDYSYRLNNKEYYYVASVIKLPVIAMSLEKLNQIEGIDKFTKMQFEKINCQNALYTDTTSQDSSVSIAHLAKKILILSDNDSYNRLYDFLGQEHINKRLWELGYTDSRIFKRFSNCSEAENRSTCLINFYDSEDSIIYTQKPIFSDTVITGVHPFPYLGIGNYDDKTRKVVPGARNMNTSTYMTLEDVHKIMKTIFFPELFSDSEKFDLTDDELDFMRKYMGILPRESHYPNYSPYNVYYDSYVKYFLLGNSTDKLADSIRIFDKVGMSFGFMCDFAYIVDYENDVEFFLSAIIYTNKNEILNDGIYEYREVALPFFEQFGKLILDYEIKRKKQFLPELLKYDFSKE